MKCGTCKFWNPEFYPDGLCERFPPAYKGGPVDKCESFIFPVVHEDMVCGEYVIDDDVGVTQTGIAEN